MSRGFSKDDAFRNCWKSLSGRRGELARKTQPGEARKIWQIPPRVAIGMILNDNDNDNEGSFVRSRIDVRSVVQFVTSITRGYFVTVEPVASSSVSNCRGISK